MLHLVVVKMIAEVVLSAFLIWVYNTGGEVSIAALKVPKGWLSKAR